MRIGPALGPVIGGTVAQLVGLRRAFLVTAGFYLVALVLVFTMYHERRAHVPSDAKREGRITFRNVLALENFVLLIAVVFGLQFVDRSFGPVLPLYVAELGTPMDAVPILSGVLFSISAGAGAVGNHLARGLLARTSTRTVIAGSAAVAALGTLTYVFAAEHRAPDDRHVGFRVGDRRGQHRGLYGGGRADSRRGARRGVWPADDRLAHRSGDEPGHLRVARHAEPASGLRPRHVRAALRRRARPAAHGHRAAGADADGGTGDGGRRSSRQCSPFSIAPDRARTRPSSRRRPTSCRRGGLVAYPTDTLYGLAVDPRRDDAVARLYAAKGRDASAAIPLIAASHRAGGGSRGRSATRSCMLARAFWPGPLTIVMPARTVIAAALLGGGTTVALRVPSHAVARALAAAFGFCITATSANRSGHPPAVTGGDGRRVARTGDRCSPRRGSGRRAGRPRRLSR